MASVRYRLVWRLLGLSNEVSKRCMEYLSRHKVHSQASGYVNHRSIRGVGMYGTQGQTNNAIADPVLRKKIDEYHASLGVSNVPCFASADINRLPGFNDHLVR